MPLVVQCREKEVVVEKVFQEFPLNKHREKVSGQGRRRKWRRIKQSQPNSAARHEPLAASRMWRRERFCCVTPKVVSASIENSFVQPFHSHFHPLTSTRKSISGITKWHKMLAFWNPARRHRLITLIINIALYTIRRDWGGEGERMSVDALLVRVYGNRMSDGHCEQWRGI